MPRVNVWIPADLHAQAKEAGLSFSTVIQAALRAALGLMPPTEHEKAAKQSSEPQVGCLHPVKERTSYGRCRLCGQEVRP